MGISSERVIVSIKCDGCGKQKDFFIPRYVYHGSDAIIQELKKNTEWEAKVIDKTNLFGCCNLCVAIGLLKHFSLEEEALFLTKKRTINDERSVIECPVVGNV
jgi:hypothetical protein